jgi:hypothetical protein
MILNINSSEVVKFTDKLERMHRKHLPKVVRDTLNNVALEGVKKNTLLKTTKKVFTNRQKNFFRANSRVDFAKGWDIKKMKSEVGMSSHKLSSNNYAVKDLEQQETGGKIKGRSFIPIAKARVSSSWNRNVKKKFRIATVSNTLIDANNNVKGKNNNQKFTLSAIHAGVGGFVIGTKRTATGSRIVFEIKKASKTKNGFRIKINPIYSVKKNRTISVKGTRFIQKSATLASKELNDTFIKIAKNELARAR